MQEGELMEGDIFPGGQSVQVRLELVVHAVLTYVPAGHVGQALHWASSFCVHGPLM